MNHTYKVQRGTRNHKVALAVAIVLIIAAAAMPWWGTSSWMREFVVFACYFIFAMTWNLLAGFGGMVSIGQQAFFGLGGYAMLILGNFYGVNPFVAVALGAIIAGIRSEERRVGKESRVGCRGGR